MFLTRISADASGGGMSDRSVFGDFWFQGLGGITSGGARVTAASAMGLPIVWDCINVLAKSFAMMPFQLFQPTDTGRTRLRKHWLNRLFCKAPNRFQTPFDWRMMLMGHLALRGNAFCQISANSRGEITELLPLHPDRMQAELLSNGSFRYVYTDETGRRITYLRSEIWHLRGLSDNGIVGLSPIEVAREAIGEGLAMQSYASRFFANDARPGGWIEFDGKFMSKDARQTFKDSWQENYGGRNLRKVAVLEKGMKYHELQLSNADAQFIEGRKDKAAELPRLWGIPPHKVGVLDKATFSNIEQQNIEFWTDTMTPWGKNWASSAEFFLLGPDTDLDVEFNSACMMRGDGKSRAERLAALVQGGIYTPNMALAEEGEDPHLGGDVIFRPLNMIAIGADGKIDNAGRAEPPETIEEPPSQEDEPAVPATGPEQARMHAILSASAGRLARRAAGAMAKKPAIDVFDADFAGLMAESFGIPPERAAAWCAKLRAAEGLTEPAIERRLLACATGA